MNEEGIKLGAFGGKILGAGGGGYFLFMANKNVKKKLYGRFIHGQIDFLSRKR